MKLAELFSRAARARRTLLVVGLQGAIALTIGAGVVLARAGGGDRGCRGRPNGPVSAGLHVTTSGSGGQKGIVGYSYYNDTSPPLRAMPAMPLVPGREMEASPNPRAVSKHQDARDTVRQTQEF